MEARREKDIIRYTLQSYIGKSIKDITLGEHQKIAISRLSGMKNERFDQLCGDLINEIQRRNGMDFVPPTVLGEKLIQISDLKFKNLVMETLTVFYLKNTQYEVEDMPEFVENVKMLIKSLKEQTERDLFLNQIENLGFYGKIYEFLDFAKKSDLDIQILSQMKKYVDEKVGKDSFEFIELCEFPDLFLKSFFSSERLNLIKNEKMKILYDQIINLPVEMNYEERSELIKKNMIEMIAIVINSTAISSKKIEYFENEISGVVEVLEGIESEIQTKTPIDLDKASLKLSEILENIITKGSNKLSFLSTDHINELKIQQLTVELINNSQSRNESFKLVIEIAKDIRKALMYI
jgi:hypothetical protein